MTDPSSQQPWLSILPAAQGERPALTTVSHPADRVLIAINKLIFWFYFKQMKNISTRGGHQTGKQYKEATCGCGVEGEEGGSELLGGHS